MPECVQNTESEQFGHPLKPRGEWFDKLLEDDVVGVKYSLGDRMRELTLDFGSFDNELDDLLSADLDEDFERAKPHIGKILAERDLTIDRRTFFICEKILEKLLKFFSSK